MPVDFTPANIEDATTEPTTTTSDSENETVDTTTGLDFDTSSEGSSDGFDVMQTGSSSGIDFGIEVDGVEEETEEEVVIKTRTKELNNEIIKNAGSFLSL